MEQEGYLLFYKKRVTQEQIDKLKTQTKITKVASLDPNELAKSGKKMDII